MDDPLIRKTCFIHAAILGKDAKWKYHFYIRQHHLKYQYPSHKCKAFFRTIGMAYVWHLYMQCCHLEACLRKDLIKIKHITTLPPCGELNKEHMVILDR